jgi:hypothetical protein
VAQTRDEERRRRRCCAASTSAPRQSTSAGSDSSLCIRRARARGLSNTATHSEIKTALERKPREILGDEYEQWRDHVKTTEEGRRLVITHQLLQRLTQNPNTTKLNEKT